MMKKSRQNQLVKSFQALSNDWKFLETPKDQLLDKFSKWGKELL